MTALTWIFHADSAAACEHLMDAASGFAAPRDEPV